MAIKVSDYIGEVSLEKAKTELLSVLHDRDELDEDVAEDVLNRPLLWVEIPTGWVSAYVCGERGVKAGVDIPVCLWLLHGKHWTAKNKPESLHMVGGAHPF